MPTASTHSGVLQQIHKFEDELMMAAAWNSSNILQRVSLTITSVPNFLIESFKQKLASLLKVRIAISFSWKYVEVVSGKADECAVARFI